MPMTLQNCVFLKQHWEKKCFKPLLTTKFKFCLTVGNGIQTWTFVPTEETVVVFTWKLLEQAFGAPTRHNTEYSTLGDDIFT